MRRRVIISDHPIENQERCRVCRADCCRSFPSVNITWKEYNTLRALGAENLYFTLSGRCKLIIENGCEFLLNNRCSIYANRPEICQRFSCEDFQSDKHKSFSLTPPFFHRKPKPLLA